MRRKIHLPGILWRLIIALALASCLTLTSTDSASALSLADYFVYSYNVELSKSQIEGSEVFYATVKAEATCTNDLPVSASEASITGRIVAEHQESGTKVTLNSGYTVTIEPFPYQQGETTNTSQVIPLQFPQGSQSGTYSIIGELIEAKVKTGIFWIPATTFLPSSQTVDSVTYSASGGTGVGGGGIGMAGAPAPGTNIVSDFVRADGTFTETIVAESFDGKCELLINRGTIGFDQTGRPLTKITMTEMQSQLTPPENFDITGITYDLGPDGSNFNPPVILTIAYDESLIPQGASEENLVIAMWDEIAGEWAMLDDPTVSPDIDTVSAAVEHFTAFAILSHIRPTTFIFNELSITPIEVTIGEEVTIRALVTNTGDLTGSHEVSLKIDNTVVTTQEVTLEGGGSEEITFVVAESAAGTYTVTLDGLSGTFTVKGLTDFAFSKLSITPVEVAIGEEVTISALITNIGNLAGSYKATLKIDNAVAATQEITLESGISEEVTFVVAESAAGTYTVALDGLSGTFVVRRPAIFTASELSIIPSEIAIGEEVTISALVTNTGDLAGSHKVILRIDNEVMATQQVTLESGGSEEVTFVVAESAAGTYTVALDGLSGTFIVKSQPAINWRFLGPIIAVCLAVVAVISVIAIFRRRKV